MARFPVALLDTIIFTLGNAWARVEAGCGNQGRTLRGFGRYFYGHRIPCWCLILGVGPSAYDAGSGHAVHRSDTAVEFLEKLIISRQECLGWSAATTPVF